MKVSDYIAEFIYAQGTTHVFEVVGGMITHLVDSMYQKGRIRIVSMHHEQAAAFAAEGFARITGIPGVAMATSGPGATNLLTGIGSCYFDSVPAVFITGQVNVAELKGRLPVRQLGFQETDIVAMARPITKASWVVNSVEEIPTRLEEAFSTAISGRPGPVLLDIPMDIQRGDLTTGQPQKIEPIESESHACEGIDSLLTKIIESKRPLILAGGGLHSGRAMPLFRQFADLLGVPVVSSLLAVDALPYSDPLRVGLIGTYGNRWANMALSQADFLLVLGSRLDIRQTGSDIKGFKGERIIYQVDCDPGEINNRVEDCFPIVCQLRSLLSQAIEAFSDQTSPDRSQWLSEIAELKALWPDTAELKSTPGINPNHFLHRLSQASQLAAAFSIDIGQHQMWAGQSIELSANQRFLTSGGMGAMGCSLPLAIGTAFALADKPVVVVAGDGGFQLNIQELQTILQYKLPVKIVILNNNVYGMVRQFQQSYFEERFQSTVWGYSAPDFALVAQAFHIPALTIRTPAEIDLALGKLWEDPTSSCLLQVIISPDANAYPKLAFGRPYPEMEPLSKPKQFGEK